MNTFSFVLRIGTFCNFGIASPEFKKQFSGIRIRPAIAGIFLYIPFFRELWLCWGNIAASAEGISKALGQSNSKHDASNSDGCTSNAVT